MNLLFTEVFPIKKTISKRKILKKNILSKIGLFKMFIFRRQFTIPELTQRGA